jgi:hypothetical protein
MPLYESIALPAQTAAGADSTTYIGTVEPSDASGYGVSSVVITPPPGYSTVTGVATNNATFNVRQVRAGSSVGTFASLTLNSGTNLVAESPVVVPVTAPPTLQSGDVFDVVMHQNGTGLAVGAGLFVTVDVN